MGDSESASCHTGNELGGHKKHDHQDERTRKSITSDGHKLDHRGVVVVITWKLMP